MVSFPPVSPPRPYTPPSPHPYAPHAQPIVNLRYLLHLRFALLLSVILVDDYIVSTGVVTLVIVFLPVTNVTNWGFRFGRSFV